MDKKRDCKTHRRLQFTWNAVIFPGAMLQQTRFGFEIARERGIFVFQLNALRTIGFAEFYSPRTRDKRRYREACVLPPATVVLLT